MSAPSVLIPVAPGTNRDRELALAFEAAGARTVRVPLEDLRLGRASLADHQILGVPGGFSYGDALAAGRLLGLDLSGWLADELAAARERGMPILGVCNGFQALVESGLLPGPVTPTTPVGTVGRLRPAAEVTATLAPNAGGSFECRWVELLPSGGSPWLDGVTETLRCPVAHGEGRFVTSDLEAVERSALVAFRYAGPDGARADGAYPANPNGSVGDVAGIVDPTGLVLGLMPHPEDHVLARQTPARFRDRGGRCLSLFEAGVAAVGG
jgi:phosphoribosylformylglycinamidine synthase